MLQNQVGAMRRKCKKIKSRKNVNINEVVDNELLYCCVQNKQWLLAL